MAIRLRLSKSKIVKPYGKLCNINLMFNCLLECFQSDVRFNHQHSPLHATSSVRLTRDNGSNIITRLSGHIGSSTISSTLDRVKLGQPKNLKPYERLSPINPIFNCLSGFLFRVRFNHQHAQPSLHFKVHRREPELIKPAQPTPYEVKHLSDIDDQEGLRFHIATAQIYRSNPSMKGKDPVKVIREALSKALVFYYPFAGRLIEGDNRKLMVECNGEGILFIEADADVSLDQFGDALTPPFPCWEELLFDVPGSSGLLNCPLILIQVTRLNCGGFFFALRLNHTMSDGTGLVQFMAAVGEIARGEEMPSISPVWERHILTASDPPCVTLTHNEYKQLDYSKGMNIPFDDMSHYSFFFGPNETSSLRQLVPQHLRNCTTFELLTACLWKCRTIALQPNPAEEMRLTCIVDARKRFNPPLPRGYYGNVIAFPMVVTTAEELSRNPLGYALELVQKVKGEVSEKYMRSVASLMVMKGRPLITVVGIYLVSDLRRGGFEEVDYGWGKAVYGGVGESTVWKSSYMPFSNKKGENGIVVPVSLPRPAMDIFVKELDGRLVEGHNRKLIVECNGEGILFVEADADVSLDQFGDALTPPIPCLEELLFYVPKSSGFLN